MPQSESFDAFYARTSWSVTSQIHALAGEDPLADHAIREAYARAYQQWYEVSAYPDAEAWVLRVAKDAYQRRQAETAVASRTPDPASDHDPLSWPGMFRPARPKSQPLSDPDATLAPRYDAPASPAAAGPVATPGLALDGRMAPHGPALADGRPLAEGSVAAGSPGRDDRGALGDAPAGGLPSAGGPTAVGRPTWAAGPTWAEDPLAPRGLPSDGGLPSAAPQAEVPPGSLFGNRPSGNPAAEGVHVLDVPTEAARTGGAVTGGALADGALADGALADRAALGGATADWADPTYGRAVGGDRPYGDGAQGGDARTGAMPTATIGDLPGGATTAGWRGSLRPGRPGGLVPGLLGSRRNLVVFATVVALVLAGGIVYALSGGKAGKAPTSFTSHGPAAKPPLHMLKAGQTGSRRAIPWPLIGPGWTLAEVSTAQPSSTGSAAGGGSYITYLVDPEGGKYRIRITSGAAAPDLLAWSGNAKEALYADGGGTQTYGLLTLSSGELTPLSLPAGVNALGFTRPDGLNILAVQLKNSKYRLERYDLVGHYQAMIASLPRPAGATDVLQGNALSSPDGTTAVWGVNGDEMELVSNAGGLIRRLRVPGTGSRPSCAPISWWSPDRVLAYCNAGAQPDAGRLWLVPVGGGHPTELTGISGSPSGQGDLVGAWQTGSAVYITSTTLAQCPGVSNRPGGEQILQLSQGGAETPVSIPFSTNDHASVVAGVDGRLLVLAQTSCPGTSSLIWFNPSTHVARTLLSEPATEAGVISAVPYGSGPAATAG